MNGGPGELSRQLSHVYWIGGSPCSGKSTIVRLLSETWAFHSYNCDDAFQRHGEQIRPEEQPTFYRVLHMTWDEIWMRPVEELLADVLAVYGEEFDLILQDLLALPTGRPIVAEGAALLPPLVHQVLADPSHAIWAAPTETFQRHHYPRRGSWVQQILSQCAHPEEAFRNWMDRDIAFGRWVAREARERGLCVLTVDGTRTIRENAERVKQLLGV
jgi:hypothetical protein